MLLGILLSAASASGAIVALLLCALWKIGWLPFAQVHLLLYASFTLTVVMADSSLKLIHVSVLILAAMLLLHSVHLLILLAIVATVQLLIIASAASSIASMLLYNIQVAATISLLYWPVAIALLIFVIRLARNMANPASSPPSLRPNN